MSLSDFGVLDSRTTTATATRISVVAQEGRSKLQPYQLAQEILRATRIAKIYTDIEHAAREKMFVRFVYLLG